MIKADEDYQIEPISNGQTIRILAVVVCNTINGCCNNDTKIAQSLFALFVHQLSSFSKEPKVIANLLRSVADEMERKADAK